MWIKIQLLKYVIGFGLSYLLIFLLLYNFGSNLFFLSSYITDLFKCDLKINIQAEFR